MNAAPSAALVICAIALTVFEVRNVDEPSKLWKASSAMPPNWLVMRAPPYTSTPACVLSVALAVMKPPENPSESWIPA